MTAVESLRRQVATQLALWPIIDFKDTALVLADACEEDGLGKFAKFWRLVAVRQVWPKRVSTNCWEWWRWTSDVERVIGGIGTRTYCLTPAVSRRLGNPSKQFGYLQTKQYRSLSKAILSLEKAWGAVDCEAASV